MFDINIDLSVGLSVFINSHISFTCSYRCHDIKFFAVYWYQASPLESFIKGDVVRGIINKLLINTIKKR